MLGQRQIEQLEAFEGGGARVLSLYLDLDPAHASRREHRIVFEDMVKAARGALDDPTRREFDREVARIQAWLESSLPRIKGLALDKRALRELEREVVRIQARPEASAPRGKGLALVSCGPRGLWQVHWLPGRVQDHLAFESRPDIAPLLELEDEYERYAVALVDKAKARLFTVFQGEIEESEALEDFVPPKHDQGGLSQANFQRHHEAHVYRQIKDVAQALARLFRRRSFDRLILAGPEEPTSELRRLLPRALAGRLVAVIPAEPFATPAEILEKTLEVERRVEREVESRLLDELLERAGAGGRASCGLASTLEALWLGDVQTLVVAEGHQVVGSECSNCGRLEPGSIATCPACKAAMRAVHDLLHRAMARTLEQAGRVEVVHGDAARRLMGAGDGVAALLRYRLPATAPALADLGR
jgi:peptide subunit release factor 1 (eRF1)